MFWSLIKKEINITSIGSKFKKDNLLNTLLGLALYAGFIAVEVFLFNMLITKLGAYDGVSEAVLAIFLAIITAISIALLALQARKSIFSQEDALIMLTKPIKPLDNIMSKVAFVYVKNVMLNFCVAFPILVSFIVRTERPLTYVALALLYPFFASMFETGFACLLAFPLQKVYELLKRFGVLQIVVSLAVIAGFCYLYSYVLNLFIMLVKDGNVSAMFTTDALETMRFVGKFLIPARFVVAVLEGQYLHVLTVLAISAAVLAVGVTVGALCYLRFIRTERESKGGNGGKFRPVRGVTAALVQKEFKLIFSTNTIFSFAGLLIVQPILTFAVVKAMNVIITLGAFSFLSSIFTFLTPITGIVVVTLFSVVINTSASLVLQKEGYGGIKICKLIPVPYKKQIFVKMLVPFVASALSLVVSIVVLVAFGEMTALNGALAFVLATLLEMIIEIACVWAELRNKAKEGSSLAAVLELASVAIPLFVVALIGVLTYAGLNFYIAFIIPLVLVIVALSVSVVFFVKGIDKRFILLETRN